MRLATLVWIAIFALCIAAAIQERPNAALTWRYRGGIGKTTKDDPLQAVPDSLAAEDPEAGDILRYRVGYDHKDPKPDQLRPLVAKYPENEFFLSRLAEGLIETDGVGLSEVLEVVDRLIAVNPDNAHHRDLRGWAILEAREGPEYFDEAMTEFELGHLLPKFYLPSSKYKARVDRLYSKAAFNYYDREKIYPFYWDLETFISKDFREGKQLSLESFRRITDSAVVMASRVIDHAYDLDSLSDGQILLEITEKARLVELELTADEARQTRYRLAQAIALEEIDRDWSYTQPGDHLIGTSLMPFGVLLSTAVASLGLFMHRRKAAVENSHWRGTSLGVCLTGLLLFLLLLTILSLRGRGLSETLISSLFSGGALFWTGYLAALAFIGSWEFDGLRRARLWITIAYVLLWLNGVLLLLAGTGGALGSASESEWTSLIPFLRIWTALCALLLWVAILDRRPLLGHIPCHIGLLVVLGFASFLMTFEIFAAQWRVVDRAYANPLASYEPLPAATQETYERFIRDSGPPRRIREEARGEAHVLPEYFEYFTPEDMEAFLAKRLPKHKVVPVWRLRALMKDCPRDVLPVIRAAIADRAETGLPRSWTEKGETP